jgi:ribonuclease BN (tRNA processing enzyme)
MCWDEQSNMSDNGENEGQCGTVGAAEMAQAANVKKLALVHIGPNLSNPAVMDSAKSDISDIFSGEIIFANELDKLYL